MPHIHELIDYTAEVFIVHKEKVLIRLHDKYNIWTCPGGHIELDETPQEWAVREAKEETWLEVIIYDGHQQFDWSTGNQKELIPPVFMNIHRIQDTNHQHIGMVYFAYAQTDDVVPLYTDDVSHDWRRMTKGELDQATDMEEHVKTYAKAAIEVYSM